jgi:hypothetical protein
MTTSLVLGVEGRVVVPTSDGGLSLRTQATRIAPTPYMPLPHVPRTVGEVIGSEQPPGILVHGSALALLSRDDG